MLLENASPLTHNRLPRPSSYHYPGVSNNVKFLPATHATLSRHPNIVGCKLSHGDISHHCQVASNPAIDPTRFHAYTGLGQQLMAAMTVGCAGAIDGCAGFFPRAMVRLYGLSDAHHLTDTDLLERKRLQYKASCCEELVVGHGTVGIKDAISRLRGFGDPDGTRLPLWGGMGDEEWVSWDVIVGAMEVEETRLGGEEKKQPQSMGNGAESGG